MAASSHNHASFQSRLDYIQQLLLHRLGFSVETKITPIQYDPECPFKYNNFIYCLSLPSGTKFSDGQDEAQAQARQPGCVPIPPETERLILRLSNPDAAGMHPETRVQNEVAILSLASQALGHIEPRVVPRVFAWGAAASHGHLGWILQEHMPGEPLAEPFGGTMSLDQKKGILAQMATLLKALQDYPLPESIKGWGGVTFDNDSGAIVSAPMTSVGAGPWSSLEESFRGRLEVALSKADTNPHLQGWRANGVRDRIDAFIERGLPEQFSRLASKRDRAIIHADFTPDNLHYDPATGRITALLDYDFASILHPAYEFFRSFATNGGRLSGWSADHEAAAIRDAKLTGQFPSPLPAPAASANGPGVDWELALAWEDELQRLQVKRPSTIPGIEGLADVDEVLGSLVPWRLTNEGLFEDEPG
ncbi:hypothetical protein QQX98_013204 [Neonectria punicea]|uniref:Aminoglycoside phosphotransferase domain-containing protein n=1 Tax=Neonectria punicea TaxID=979145 RepID=A0ABR1GGR4_9HYPO